MTAKCRQTPAAGRNGETGKFETGAVRKTR